jgi:putative transposase
MKGEPFNSVKFDRGSIPAALTNMQTWPAVDDRALDNERRGAFLKRTAAMELFVGEQSVSLRQITERTGIDRKTVVRLFKRCTERHKDGRIFGFRAPVPFRRLQPYYERFRACRSG